VRSIVSPCSTVWRERGPRATPSSFHVADSAIGETSAAKLRRAQDHVASRRWGEAWAELRELPRRQKSDAGRDVSLLVGFAAYKNAQILEARRVLDPLANDEAYARRRPAALYYAGRAAWAAGSYAAAVDRFARFAELMPVEARVQAGLEK
jgi:outer membrane protein assembly factor BamD (BamD/ComL family)